MSIHYNAFISYRHHPDDVRVASDIHRSLEHFKVPRSIKKKNGEIKRLFRDKEELPITSNLTDDIEAALRNSDYLIVICSVHTKESIWVQREIELFLQNHERNKILTVLASGEPYDVIPEILLYNDVVDPKTGQTVRQAVEPLSCDWRMKRRKAKQEELPRLAAALLGCGYDALRQRQKQYRARRNMAIVSTSLAASLCLTAYFLYTSITIQRANEQIKQANEEIQAANVQIKANLDESLINQSMHLATAAQERLDGGDRLTAIALAMAALPQDGNPRPYVPEAENVLISALGIYRDNNQPTAIGTVSPGMNIGIRNFWVTDSDRVLYIYDQRKHLTVWDTDSLKKTAVISLEEFYLDKLMTLPNDNALVLLGLGENIVRCYRPDGTEIWSWSDCRDVAYIPENHTVLLIHQVETDHYELIRANADTGDIYGEPVSLNLDESALSPNGFIVDTLSRNTNIVIRYYSFDKMAFYSVNPTTAEKTEIQVPSAYAAAAVITDDNKFLMMGESEGLGIAGWYGGDRVTSPEVRKIGCYDLNTGSLLWENEIATTVYGVHTLQVISGREQVLCQDGNIFQIIDITSGETLATCAAGGGIMSVSVGQDYASAVLQDGYVCYYWYNGNYCYEVKCMKNDISHAASGATWYALHTDSDHVTLYRSVVGEPDWQYDLVLSTTLSNRITCGQYLAFQDYSYLYLMDLEARSIIWQTERDNNELMGFSTDGTKLWYVSGKETVCTLNIATGNVASNQITMDVKNPNASIRGKFFLVDDCLYYMIGGTEKCLLVSWNLTTQEKITYNLDINTPEDITYWSWEVLSADGDYIWLWGHEQLLLELNTVTGETIILAEQTSQRPVITVQDTGNKIAFVNQGVVCTKTPGDDKISEITLDNANAGSVCYSGEKLLVLCDNGFMYRLDNYGNIVSQTKLFVDSSFSSLLLSNTDPTMVTWQFTQDNKLVLNALGTGNIIDCETWGVFNSIPYFLSYDEKNDCLICQSPSSICAYPVFDTAELIEMAKDELNGFDLSQEQKVSYGIE